MTHTKISAVLVFAISLAGFAYGEPIGTAFTYQGHLYDDNHIANGSYDFQFSLFDSLADGNQIGSDVNKNDVNVVDGYFTAELDFGDAFADELRWLEIGVRDGGSSGAYTTLSPRQKITAVPYAIRANAAEGGGSVVSGNLEGVCHDPNDPAAPNDVLPAHPFEFDISELGAVEPNDAAISLAGFKMSSGGAVEKDLWFEWEVTTSPYPLTLRVSVWDADNNPYDCFDGINWEDKRIKLSYIAAGPDGGTGISSSSKIVGGRISGEPPATYPFEFNISELGVGASDVMVVASGSKLTSGGEPETPLMIKWDVNDSPLTVKLRVWDSLGVQYSPTSGAWMGRKIDMSFAAFDPNSSPIAAAEGKVVIDLNLDKDGNIVTGLIPQEDYYGTVTRLYLRDLPNLKQRLGGSGITLATVNNSVKKLILSAETYSDVAQNYLEGFRWARVDYGPVGTDETDIYWAIKIYEEESGSTEDTDATYKLIRAEAHLK